ncbi:menaquinol-cytochrome c reductase cytochrome b subunit [Actinomadura rubrobrunea]|uniref:Cytochrome bc1 complex cytochrome b subunit n=1 Tax=Actinomadura rubrobrunea TaxID=115335 RepID=A0A9W6Q2S4_9ACTN|nr:menaquinol-cytochrome c reductase cytochrome b subunit [Actinomadura rubrobrunea]
MEGKVLGAADAIDERFGSSSFFRRAMRKAFPDHWSFLLGEIALYSFFVLLLTGAFLTLFFKPSMAETVYDGAYEPLQGVRMSEAYASVLHISFEVRGGLLLRQIHHWAANIFLAAMMVHMLRIFFTGAFRKPRDVSWLLGVALLALSLAEGFAGYSLPDDLLSGTGLRIAHGMVMAIPVVGSYLAFFLFGGEFPGEDLMTRLYILHVLLIPGIMLALVPLHGIVLPWRVMHTHFPGRGRTERNQIGVPFFPVFVAKTTAFAMFVVGVTALLATFLQINPVWLYGPYQPSEISAGSQPDWYLGWLEGALRIMPSWEITAFGHTLTLSLIIPGLVVPGLLFTGLALYPFLERWATNDPRYHNLLDRPRDAATRTGIGAAGVTFFGLLWLAGGNDVIAKTFHVPLFATTWVFRFAVLAGPVLAFFITRHLCLGLQRRDQETLAHGVETGVIKRSPSGAMTEIHKPPSADQLPKLRARKTLPRIPAGSDGNGVPAPVARRAIGKVRVALNRAYVDGSLTNGDGDGHLKRGAMAKTPAAIEQGSGEDA